MRREQAYAHCHLHVTRFVQYSESKVLWLPQSNMYPHQKKVNLSPKHPFQPTTTIVPTFMELQEFIERATPLGRPLYSLQLSKEDKNRVRDADPNGGRCLITNSRYSINYCHCIPKTIMNDENIVSGYRIYSF